MALAVCALSAECRAAGPAGPSLEPELRTLLASANVLSETAMARQKGSGLRSPSIITNEQGGSPRVLLWDELRILPLLTPMGDGVVTGGGGGK